MSKVLVTFVRVALLFVTLAGAAHADGDAATQRGESHSVWVWAFKSGCDAAGYGDVARGYNVWAMSGNAWYLYWAYTGNGGGDWLGFYAYCRHYAALPTARLMCEPLEMVTLLWGVAR